MMEAQFWWRTQGKSLFFFANPLLRRAAFLQQLKSKVGLALAKAAALRINLNLDGASIASKSHTHPTNPVCERRVNLLVCSLPLHRHSYIGFILTFTSSIHNKQKIINIERHQYWIKMNKVQWWIPNFLGFHHCNEGDQHWKQILRTSDVPLFLSLGLALSIHHKQQFLTYLSIFCSGLLFTGQKQGWPGSS